MAIKLTSEILERLQDLKNKLHIRVGYDTDPVRIKSVRLEKLIGWEIKPSEKRWWGRTDEKITKLFIKTGSQMKNSYIGEYSFMLDEVIYRMEQGRAHFARVRNELSQFGYEIKKKENDEISKNIQTDNNREDTGMANNC